MTRIYQYGEVYNQSSRETMRGGGEVSVYSEPDTVDFPLTLLL